LPSSSPDRTISRRRFFGAIAVTAALGPGVAAGTAPILVEDWSGHRVGARGVPAGWRSYETPGGHPRYDFTVVEDGERRALELKSTDDHSTIAREIDVDLAVTPVLEWAWRIVTQPAGADLTRRATSDASGHIFVVWPRFPAMLRSRLVGYVWDPAIAPDTVVRSAKTSLVSFVVARSGARGLGEWSIERHDVAADYRRIYGETAPRPGAVALSIDTNDTRASAAARFGRIAFLAR
jgi:Protein of unknown function (DUF3047)